MSRRVFDKRKRARALRSAVDVLEQAFALSGSEYPRDPWGTVRVTHRALAGAATAIGMPPMMDMSASSRAAALVAAYAAGASEKPRGIWAQAATTALLRLYARLPKSERGL